MTARLAGALVNGLLVAAAFIALFPLAWMLSVSFMQPGEASAFPPPLLPAHATLANYHTLFARAGMGRHLANSLLIAGATTLLSLLFNLAAGYTFAKLRFAGRERLFRSLLGALVIPAQVAMIPLFLLMKWLGLVNTWGGVVVPALASVFGIFLVRQYARSIPNELLEAALACCVNMTVRMYADRHAIPLDAVATRVRLDRGAEGAIFHTETELHGTSLTPEQREKLLAAAKSCPVRRTLSGSIRFDG